jgi:hypothetical protein
MELYKKTSISQVYTHTHVGKYNKNWDYCLAFIFRVSPSVFSNCRRAHKRWKNQNGTVIKKLTQFLLQR